MAVTDLRFQFSVGILMHSLFEEVMHRVTQLKAHGIWGLPYSSSSFAKKLRERWTNICRDCIGTDLDLDYTISCSRFY